MKPFVSLHFWDTKKKKKPSKWPTSAPATIKILTDGLTDWQETKKITFNTPRTFTTLIIALATFSRCTHFIQSIITYYKDINVKNYRLLITYFLMRMDRYFSWILLQFRCSSSMGQEYTLHTDFDHCNISHFSMMSQQHKGILKKG